MRIREVLIVIALMLLLIGCAKKPLVNKLIGFDTTKEADIKAEGDEVSANKGTVAGKITGAEKLSIGDKSMKAGGNIVLNTYNNPDFLKSVVGLMSLIIGYCFARMKALTKWVNNIVKSNDAKDRELNEWRQKYIETLTKAIIGKDK